jgi:hypothetical protein
LREQVADALNGIGFHHLCQAKERLQHSDEAAARDLLVRAEADIAEARSRSEDPFILGNAGYISFLLGRTDEARTLLALAFQLGGEELRQAALEDSNIHPLPQDEVFRALVRSL